MGRLEWIARRLARDTACLRYPSESARSRPVTRSAIGAIRTERFDEY